MVQRIHSPRGRETAKEGGEGLLADFLSPPKDLRRKPELRGENTMLRKSLLGKGFTLIELLIVVAIIAILAAIAVPNFLEAQVRSKVSRVKSDQRSLATALEAYMTDVNSFPHRDDYSFSPQGVSGMIPLTTPVAFITSIPRDPFFVPENPGGGGPRELQTFEYTSGGSKVLGIAPTGDCAGSPGATEWAPWPKDMYMMMSPGPKKEERLNTGSFPDGYTADSTCAYDSSNGTTSFGNIYRYNVPPQFAQQFEVEN
jgi:prepilin-type N-terminal cleavage/methylation domain-containing protein